MIASSGLAATPFALQGAPWAHHQVVLNHVPRVANQVRHLPCKHILVRTEEADQHFFLVWWEAGAYGEGEAGALIVDLHLLCLGPVLREQLLLLCGRGLRSLRGVPGIRA